MKKNEAFETLNPIIYTLTKFKSQSFHFIQFHKNLLSKY